MSISQRRTSVFDTRRATPAERQRFELVKQLTERWVERFAVVAISIVCIAYGFLFQS